MVSEEDVVGRHLLGGNLVWRDELQPPNQSFPKGRQRITELLPYD